MMAVLKMWVLSASSPTVLAPPPGVGPPAARAWAPARRHPHFQDSHHDKATEESCLGCWFLALARSGPSSPVFWLTPVATRSILAMSRLISRNA